MSLSEQEIQKELLLITRNFLQELSAERAIQAISLDAAFDRELGIDSLGKVELFHRLEIAFGIRFSENTIAEAKNLRELIPLIQKNPEFKIEKITKDYSRLKEISFDFSSANSLAEVLEAYAEKAPERPHIYLQNEHGEEKIITYDDLYKTALSVAKGLQQRGIRVGQTVAIMLPTSEDFFCSFMGILLAGAVPVPIYPPFRPDRIEEYAKREAKILHNAQVRILITFSRAEILSNILRTFIPSLKEVISFKKLCKNTGSFDKIITTPDDIALIQYTSGSTGDPKGVVILHKNMLANIRAIIKGIPLKPTDINVSWLPLYHDMGLMSWLASLYYGIPVTILSPLTFLTRPEQWLWAIHYHRATISGGPNFAYELCVKKINPKDIEGLDLSSWRFAFNGAEAINIKTLERFGKQFGPYGFKMETFAPVYGLAENTVGLTFAKTIRPPRVDKIKRDILAVDKKAIPALPNEQNTLEFVCCGEVMPDHELRVVDDDFNVVTERTVGNIQFKGPSAMQGYFNNPTATQAIFHAGWWNTGDLGYLADNEIFITGRKKDVIIKAGRNYYPEEIEEVVNQLDKIRKGCVIAFGVQDSLTGTEKLIVVAETYADNPKDQQTIRAEITDKMSANLNIPPDTIVLVPAHTIPKTSSGKLQRSECKRLFTSGKLTKQKQSFKFQFAKLTLISMMKKFNSGLSNIGKSIYLCYVGVIFLLTIPFLSLSLFILPQKSVAVICKNWARIVLFLGGCAISQKGGTQLNTTSPVIFVANHASYLDALVLVALLPPGVVFAVKKELLTMPIISLFIKKLAYLPIDRWDFNQSLADKKMIATALQHKSLVIFPEGTFTYATGLRPFKLGAFTLAVDTQTPICPVSIKGTRTILRDETILPKPGKIQVNFGNIIKPLDTSWAEVTRIQTLVRKEIAEHCGEPVLDMISAIPP